MVVCKLCCQLCQHMVKNSHIFYFCKNSHYRSCTNKYQSPVLSASGHLHECAPKQRDGSSSLKCFEDSGNTPFYLHLHQSEQEFICNSGGNEVLYTIYASNKLQTSLDAIYNQRRECVQVW